MQLVNINQTNDTIVPRKNVNKDTESRMRKFRQWLDETGRTWLQPDLNAYRDYLLEQFKASTVETHISTVRSELKYLARREETRNIFLRIVFEALERQGINTDPANVSAYSREVELRFQNALHPDESRVKKTKVLHNADADHVRLTKAQVYDLLEQPDTQYTPWIAGQGYDRFDGLHRHSRSGACGFECF